MGNLMCKQKISDETSDTIEENKNKDVSDKSSSQLSDNIFVKRVETARSESKHVISQSENNTEKIYGKSSFQEAVDRKVADIDTKDVDEASYTDEDLQYDSGDTFIRVNHIKRDNIGAQKENILSARRHRDNASKDVEKIASDNSSGYLSHTDLASPDCLPLNEPIQTDRKTSSKRTIRRHQSLPAEASIKRYGISVHRKVVLPAPVNETQEDALGENNNHESTLARLNAYSTSDPRNRPKAAHGTRSRPSSFNVGPMTSSQVVVDKTRREKSNSFIRSDLKSGRRLYSFNDGPKIESQSFGNKIQREKSSSFVRRDLRSDRIVPTKMECINCEVPSLECDISDIQIHIKRSIAQHFDKKNPVYKASVLVNSAGLPNGIKLDKPKPKLSQSHFGDYKVQLKLSSDPNICEITLPTRVFCQMKTCVDEEYEPDEVSYV